METNTYEPPAPPRPRRICNDEQRDRPEGSVSVEEQLRRRLRLAHAQAAASREERLRMLNRAIHAEDQCSVLEHQAERLKGMAGRLVKHWTRERASIECRDDLTQQPHPRHVQSWFNADLCQKATQLISQGGEGDDDDGISLASSVWGTWTSKSYSATGEGSSQSATANANNDDPLANYHPKQEDSLCVDETTTLTPFHCCSDIVAPAANISDMLLE